MPNISFDDFKKVEVTVGKILTAERVPDTDKLLKLQVDFGPKPAPVLGEGPLGQPTEQNMPGKEGTLPRDIRQIISGIALYFPDIQVLIGKKCMFVTNLEPRVIRGLESNGMLFAVSTDDGKFSLLEPSDSIPEGTRAK